MSASRRGHTSTTHRPLPPFGTERTRQPGAACWVFAGIGAWKSAHCQPEGRRLVLPDGEDAGSFDWPVRRAEIVVRAPGFDMKAIQRLAAALGYAGANLVLVLPDIRVSSGRVPAPGDTSRWHCVRPGQRFIRGLK